MIIGLSTQWDGACFMVKAVHLSHLNCRVCKQRSNLSVQLVSTRRARYKRCRSFGQLGRLTVCASGGNHVTSANVSACMTQGSWPTCIQLSYSQTSQLQQLYT